MPQYDMFAVLEPTPSPDLNQWLRNGQIDVYNYIVLTHAQNCRREGDSVGAKATHKGVVHQKGQPKLSRYGRNVLTLADAGLDQMRSLGLIGLPTEALAALPEETVICEFDFVLDKNFLSRDDGSFYPIENPVRKERVFKVPMIPGSGWKGSLRGAAVEGLVLRKSGSDKKIRERLELIEIFGDEKGYELDDDDPTRPSTLAGFLDDEFRRLGILGEFRAHVQERFGLDADDELHHQGRLRFLPSYFDGIDLDIINPRDRSSRAGTEPIAMEVVPAGCQARFSLLYLPYDLLGRENADIRSCQLADWQLIGEALVRMFRFSGFGAKKSTGCGKARSAIANTRFETLMTGFRSPAEITTIDGLLELYRCFEVTA